MLFRDIVKVKEDTSNNSRISKCISNKIENQKSKNDVVCYLNGRAMTKDRLKRFIPNKNKKKRRR